MKLLVGNYISRPSCAQCHFKGYARKSDLTIGDFWGVWDIAPDMDDDKGTSVVLIQSEKGRSLWERISSEMVVRKVTLDEASEQNQAMIQKFALNDRHGDALTLIKEGRIAECEKWFLTENPPVSMRVKCLLKHLLYKLVRK